MNEKLKIALDKVKNFLKHATIYSIIGLFCVSSFCVGFYYNEITNNKKTIKVSKIYYKDINLAIDQYNNLMVIDVKTGNYTVYEDSVGKSIFNIYAKHVISKN
jgi:hypothetical protein